MNKRGLFITGMIFLISLCVISLALSKIFLVAERDFVQSFAGFLGAIWQGVEIKNADKPLKRFMINSVKSMFLFFKKPNVYRALCWFFCSCFLVWQFQVLLRDFLKYFRQRRDKGTVPLWQNTRGRFCCVERLS